MQDEKPQMRTYGKRHCPTCEQYGPIEGGAVVDKRTGRWECKSCLERPSDTKSKSDPIEWSLYVSKQKITRNSAFDTLSALWNGQRDSGGGTQQPTEGRQGKRDKGA